MMLQPFDLTTLRAVHHDLNRHWIPARVETLLQTDLWTLHLALRTLQGRAWILLSWHPQAARLHRADPPPKQKDEFQFSQTLQRLKGLALIGIEQTDPWERVLDIQFSARPGDPPLWHLYLEAMGKYSNIALVDPAGMIVACGHGVSERQSSVRPVQPGLVYQSPPELLNAMPDPAESLSSWQERAMVLPGKVSSRLLQSYRGLSGALVNAMLHECDLDPQVMTSQLTTTQWEGLFQVWQEWLGRLGTHRWDPGWTDQGYTLMGWGIQRPVSDLQDLIQDYYRQWINQETFQRERNQLLQKIKTWLQKLYHRRDQFREMLQQADQADQAKQYADLLMAHLQEWRVGMSAITLPDFHSQTPVQIPLDPEKNAILNAQFLYKKHRKQKRAQTAVLPLLEKVNLEVAYLEQVEGDLLQLDHYRHLEDLQTLQEIRQELIQQGLLSGTRTLTADPHIHYRRYKTPAGFEVWVGRNNRQNDWLTFRSAQDTDWWFHAQEIPGSHVLLKLPPGSVPEPKDLQTAAALAAYYSRARQSDQVPVVYTRPKNVFKPKGSPPGLVVYKQEKVVWAQPNAPDIQGLIQAQLDLPDPV